MPAARTRIAWRDLDGVLLLDKPRGDSSNRALQTVRRMYRAAKAGHTGSLDPLATGMLPVCFGEATKLAGGLLGQRKCYLTTARLGERTDTDDADGQVLERRPLQALDAAVIEAALAPLRGRIAQVPPAYSALKRDGEPLYAKARRGEVVEVAARTVEVHELCCTRVEVPEIDLRVTCGSGTYVRSLVRDFGAALGCGAHVVSLRRLWVEPFVDTPMYTLAQLQAMEPAVLEASLLPIEAALCAWPTIEVDAGDAARLRHGQTALARFPQCAGEVGVLHAGRALGLARVDAEAILRPQRMFRDRGPDTRLESGIVRL